MNIPYRTRRILQQVTIVSLIVFVVAAVVWLCWFVWLGRYVVYTRSEGAVLDFSLSAQLAEGQAALPPEEAPPVSIYYNEGENAINTSKELIQLQGYYVDKAALAGGVDTVRQQAKALPRGTPVMIEVKSAWGEFFYSSAVGTYRNEGVDAQQVDALIKELDDAGVYLIARLPALRDRLYGLNNVDDGVFDTRGAYLYRDDGRCYWLNPKRQGTMTYLANIIGELKNLGFDEVVLDYFDFPDTKYMRFDGDKEQTLVETAKTLSLLASDSFAVSFVQKPGFALPEARSRLYVTDAAAADAALIAQQTGLEDTAVKLVFLTENHDTRFDAYGVLRPLDAAH